VGSKQVYKVLVVGAGKRGKHHAVAFRNHPRFELAGVSSRDPEKLAKVAAELGVSRTSTDPLAFAKEIRPDVFCFCTPPAVCLDLIKIGVESNARLIAYEKPLALSMWNATPVTDQMAFAAPFSSIGRIRPRLRPPKTARTEQLSTTAWDQSIWPLRESQFSNTK
jgi:hypothetical protein